MKNTPRYVSRADGNSVIVQATANEPDLSILGFVQDPEVPQRWHIRVVEIQEKARVLEALRDKGLAFEKGREWDPAEVFEWLRDQNLVRGLFTSISWRAPGDWFLDDSQ